MNAHCAHQNCRRIFYIDGRPRGRSLDRIYCSRTCKQREAHRLRAERQGKPVPKATRTKEGRTCALAACGLPIPGYRRLNALYCSPGCAALMSTLEKRQARREWWEARGLLHAPSVNPKPVAGAAPAAEPAKPVAVAPAPPEVPADPCEGCRHVRPQPASFRGVECGRAVFRACNPLGFDGPRLKEAV